MTLATEVIRESKRQTKHYKIAVAITSALLVIAVATLVIIVI